MKRNFLFKATLLFIINFSFALSGVEGFINSANAQEREQRDNFMIEDEKNEEVKQGKTKLDYDGRIDDLIEKHKKYKAEQKITGYRIQLIASTNRDGPFGLRAQIRLLYPEMTSYLLFEQPYFKLRVGDYRNRFEAYKASLMLKENFARTAIYPSEIKLKLPTKEDLNKKIEHLILEKEKLPESDEGKN